jgi:FdhD protein
MGTKPVSYLQISPNHQTPVDGEIIEEVPLTLYINAQEWLTMMCTPVGVEDLVVGFLLGEKIITSMDDVELLDITHNGMVADVWLRYQVTLPQQRTLTSGCVGGTTFTKLTVEPDDIRVSDSYDKDDSSITPEQVFDMMQQLHKAAVLYPKSQGVHTSALSDSEKLLAIAEDVGRHNTLDKIRGACLRQNIPTAGNILLTTGRISSEMLRKAIDMKVYIVISRTSPTTLSLAMAKAQNVTLIGYVRGRQLRLYHGNQLATTPQNPSRLYKHLQT